MEIQGKVPSILPGYCSAVYVGIRALHAPTVILTDIEENSSNFHEDFPKINLPIIAREIVNHKLSSLAKLMRRQATPAVTR
jgi:hypothetical protein